MFDNRKVWIGLGASVVLLALFFLTVDLSGMLEALADANYAYLAPAVVMALLSVLFRTMRWQMLLRHMRPIGLFRLYPVVVVGYMANNLLPMRLGELVRSYHLGEREGVSKTSALATIFVERVADALTLLFFVAAIALFVPLTGVAEGFGERSGIYWPLLVIALSLPFVIAFVAMVVLASYPATGRSLAMGLVRPLPERFEAPLRNLIELLLQGLTPLRSPGTLAKVFLVSVPVWLFEAALFYFIGFSFGLHEAFDGLAEMAVAILLVTAIANIGSSIPAAPGGLGLFEVIARETLVLMPLAVIDRAVAGGYAVVVHATLLLPMIVLGQLFLWTEHLSLRRLWRPAGDHEASTHRPSDDLEPAGAYIEAEDVD